MSFGSFNTFNTLIQSVKIFLNPPTIVIPTVSSSIAVSVAFTAPGGTITSYTATSNPSGLTGTGSSSPITVSGLSPNTTYTFTVTATNTGGTSVASSTSSTVTTISGSPTIIGLLQQLLVNKPPYGRYSASSWVQGSLTLTDETGSGRNGVGTGTLTQTTSPGNGATASIPFIQGITTDTILWPPASIATSHTICFITRYASGVNQQRIMTAFGDNVILGHHVSKRGVVFNGDWKTTQATVAPTTDWMNFCYTNGSVSNPIPNNILVNGVGQGTQVGGSGVVSQLGINIYPGEFSDFQIAQLLIWNQVLTPAELGIVSNAYTLFLATGILLSPTVTVSSSTTVSVAFTAPSGNGTITSYTVTSSPGSLTGTGSSSPITVSGLTPNTNYTFTVSATNSGGTSVPSSSSTTVTTISGPPTLIGGLLQQLLVNKPAWGRYSASSWVQGTLTLTDETGNGRHCVGTGALTQASSSGNGATVSIPYIQGITTDTMLWPTASIATTHTICGITRYSSSTTVKQQRILTSAFTQNVLIGHHGSDIVKRGVVYNGDGAGGGWKTNQTTITPTLDWLNICYTNGSVGTNPSPNNILVNGVGNGISSGGDGVVSRLGINNGFYTSEISDFQIAQLLIWNQVLTPAELVIVSNAYTQFLATGIILPVTVLSSTTVSVAFTAPSGGGFITSYTATSSPGMLNIIDISNLVLYYPFNSTDLSGTTIANWATGSPVYDASMTGTTTITANQISTLTAGTNLNGVLINRNIPRTGFTGLTFSFWFMATSIPSSDYYFLTTLQDVLGFNGGNRFFITIDQSNKLSINNQFITSLTVVVNTLYHIVVTINNTGTPNTTVYVNNVSQTGNTTYPTFTNVSGYNSIGRDPVTGGKGLLGTLDDYRLYNRSITASEVNTLFLAGTTSGASPISVSGASSPITVSGLTPNTIYTFSVSATNSGGTSVTSTSTATTRTSAPTIGTATVSSSTAINVAFTAPSGSGTITNYTVTSSNGFIVSGASSPITVSGLLPNTSYTFTVTATNSGGISTSSSQSIAVTTPV